MTSSVQNEKLAGLYVLGSLYPVYTGGMEIFNYYFLGRQLTNPAFSVYYLGEQSTDKQEGHFVLMKKRWPARIFYPFQFFFAVFKLRNQLDYAYLSYAEESWIISLFTSLTLRLFNISYIITIHWGKQPTWTFRYPYVSYLKHAHAVIGVSEPICRAFTKTVPGLKVTYIPPLIPFLRSETEKKALRAGLGYTGNEIILLYVGTLKPMKNPDKIVEAFRVMGASFLKEHQIRMVFAGSGELDQELKTKVEKYDLTEYIRFVGMVSRKTIPDYYKAADCYIISSDYEGTSLSLLEAMYNGLGIIGSNGPGINQMLQHEENALLYETTDVEQLAATIKRICLDPDLRKQLGEKALSDFERLYSYETMIKKYESVFLSVDRRANRLSGTSGA